MRYLDRLQPLALLVMRLTLGAVMVVHGYHKVFGGLHHHVQLVTSLGLPAWTAYLSAYTEFLGGLLVLMGLLTRGAAFAICIDLAVAIPKVHLHNGLTGNGGYEFPLGLARSPLGSSSLEEAPSPSTASVPPVVEENPSSRPHHFFSHPRRNLSHPRV